MPAAAAANGKAKNVLRMDSILDADESIARAFFGDGPAYYEEDKEDLERHIIVDDNGNYSIEPGYTPVLVFYSDISGNYTIYVKTNKRIFSVIINLSFNGSSIVASIVADSISVIYS